MARHVPWLDFRTLGSWDFAGSAADSFRRGETLSWDLFAPGFGFVSNELGLFRFVRSTLD